MLFKGENTSKPAFRKMTTISAKVNQSIAKMQRANHNTCMKKTQIDPSLMLLTKANKKRYNGVRRLPSQPQGAALGFGTSSAEGDEQHRFPFTSSQEFDLNSASLASRLEKDGGCGAVYASIDSNQN